SESALEIGWVCTTTLIAQITAINANARNKITSIQFSRKQRHQQSSDEQVKNGGWEQAFPSKCHQLVITEARQRSANPDKYKQQYAGLGNKPEQRRKDNHDRWNQERRGQTEENHREYRKRELIETPRRIQPVIQAQCAS